MADQVRLILASGSKARQLMLKSAGLAFEVIPSQIDEDAISSALQTESACIDANDIASHLASEKALWVAKKNPGAFVIGSDQVLALGPRLVSKAQSIADARETLDHLRGRTHELVSAVALAQGSEVLWSTVESADMTMRKFSDAFLSRYLAHAGSGLLSSVGCYELEGLGVQLFEKIEGDYFTILGMPLLPLLEELRNRGVISP